MQEEVTQKTIALSVKTARVTADVLKNMLRKYLSGQKQKGKNVLSAGMDGEKAEIGRWKNHRRGISGMETALARE